MALPGQAVAAAEHLQEEDASNAGQRCKQAHTQDKCEDHPTKRESRIVDDLARRKKCWTNE